MRSQLSLSPSESARVAMNTYCVLFFLLMNTLLVSLLSVFVGIHFWKTEEPRSLSLTTGLVARIWCSHCCNLASISGWKLKPHVKPLEVKATRDQYDWPQSTSITAQNYHFFFFFWWEKLRSNPSASLIIIPYHYLYSLCVLSRSVLSSSLQSHGL